jgi:predicted ArsR family transcriptional regulator
VGEANARGESAATGREPTSESGWVSTQQAAKSLGVSPRTIRWHIEKGNLEARTEGEGVQRAWLVSIDSLQSFRDARQRQQQSPRAYRTPDLDAEIAADIPGNPIRELADRLVEEARRAEEARMRLELSERAQSTLEAELADERRRREETERERDELRQELEAFRESHEESPEPPETAPDASAPTDAGGEAQEATERPEGRSWWRRMFGG